MKFHHIGIVTDNMQRDIIAFEFLGYKKLYECIDEIQSNKLVFMQLNDSGGGLLRVN